jgi:hypothetical protein
MSGGILAGILDFAAFSFEFGRLHCGLERSLLVRNWCGPGDSVLASYIAGGGFEPLGFVLTHQPQPLINLAMAAAVCMGLCSLLSRPSRDMMS